MKTADEAVKRLALLAATSISSCDTQVLSIYNISYQSSSGLNYKFTIDVRYLDSLRRNVVSVLDS